jgi:hypothetical protein
MTPSCVVLDNAPTYQYDVRIMLISKWYLRGKVAVLGVTYVALCNFWIKRLCHNAIGTMSLLSHVFWQSHPFLLSSVNFFVVTPHCFGNNPQRVSASSWLSTFRNAQNLVITEGMRTSESCSLQGCNYGSEPVIFGLCILDFDPHRTRSNRISWEKSLYTAYCIVMMTIVM